jgi:hypothetical protein
MVKIIYCGYRGTYAAYVMAAIHTGVYKKEILPTFDVLQRQWNICAKYGEQYGNLMYIGLDENLNEVYTLGCRGYYDVIKMEYEGMNSIFGIDEKVWYVDCRTWDRYLPCLIARIYKYPWMDNINKRLFLYWINRIYKSCIQNVDKQKTLINKSGL